MLAKRSLAERKTFEKLKMSIDLDRCSLKNLNQRRDESEASLFSIDIMRGLAKIIYLAPE